MTTPEPRIDVPRGLRSGMWAFVGSMLIHLLVFLALGISAAPKVTLPIRLPLEMEIGLGEGKDEELGGNAAVEGKRSDTPNEQGQDNVTKPAPPRPTRPAPKPVAEASAKAEAEPSVAPPTSTLDAGVSGSTAPADAAVGDAAVATLAGSGTADAGPSGPRRGMGGGTGSGFGTAGALLALRIDVPQVRASALILETEALVSLVPGWQRMFAGSGLAPLQHFTRFVIASPNLHPSRLAMAAIVRAGLRGVERLRERASERAPLRQEADMTIGAWSSRGATTREIAFLNDDTFAIARAQDVSRLLALGRVLGAEVTDPDRLGDPLLDGLLHMGASEALSLSVHHVAAFLPEPSPHVPTSLRIVLREPTQYEVQLQVTGQYESTEQAEQGLSRWRTTYEELASGPRIAEAGLAGAVEHARFERVDARVIATTQLTIHQLRYLLGLVRELLQSLVPSSPE